MMLKTEIGTINMDLGIDLSIAIGDENRYARAWYVSQPKIEPVVGEDFIGAVSEGSSVNFRNIHFNPHGHGTHTETYGHISEDIFSINEVNFPLLMKSKLISIEPEIQNSSDRVIGLKQFTDFNLKAENIEAVIIRTLPNTEKLNKDYSNTNPAYLEKEIAAWLRDQGVKHLLIDLPSVDKEQDEGKLSFHHAFWNYPAEKDRSRTITEFIYVNDSVEDGDYLLNLAVSPFENDAAPSRPTIYKIIDPK